MKNKILVLITMVLLVSMNVYAKVWHKKGSTYKNKKSCKTYGGYELDSSSAGGNIHHDKNKHNYKKVGHKGSKSNYAKKHK